LHKAVNLGRDNVGETLADAELEGEEPFTNRGRADLRHSISYTDSIIFRKGFIKWKYFLLALKPLTFTSVMRVDHNLSFSFRTFCCSQTPTDEANLR
jgi:hypothetical protein